jgi:hypothetical protein
VDTYIVILGETEELSDLRGALGTKTLWVDDIGQTWNVGVALLDNAEGEDGEIHSDDAATDGFTLALTSSAGAVAGVAFAEEETNTGWVHDSLLHWETLLVVASGDLEDVALELVANAVTWNLCTHSAKLSGSNLESSEDQNQPLVHEYSQFSLVFNFNKLLAAIGRL